MKILLDECVTRRLKAHLSHHDVSTVKEQGWAGFKNGALMAAAAEAGFDVLLTIDKNVQYQQNIGKYNLALIIFDTASSKLEVLIHFLPEFEKQLPIFQKGTFYLISI